MATSNPAPASTMAIALPMPRARAGDKCGAGVAHAAHTMVAPVDVAALAALSLPDHTGTHHRLGDEWADRPVVLVFLRHFG